MEEGRNRRKNSAKKGGRRKEEIAAGAAKKEKTYPIFAAPPLPSRLSILLSTPDNSLLAQILHRPPESGPQVMYVDHVVPR